MKKLVLFLEDRKTLFLFFSAVLAALVLYYFGYNAVIFAFALITSLIVVVSLNLTVTVVINSLKVCFGWGFINFALFYAIGMLLNIHEFLGHFYFLGILSGYLVSGALLIVASYFSYHLKLNELYEAVSLRSGKDTSFNGCRIYLSIGFIASFIVALCEIF